MSNLILQPADMNHYNKTIREFVPLSDIQPFLSNDEVKALSNVAPDGRIGTWGVTPALNKSNIPQWEKIEVGDVVCFTQKAQIFGIADVVFKAHNRALAQHLWGNDEEGQTWEYLYFVRNVRSVNIPYRKITAISKNKPKYVIRRIVVLDDARSKEVLQALSSYVEPSARKRPPRKLVKYSDYSREEVHGIFSPGTDFTPQRGAWGMQGIVTLDDRPGDYIVFVTFGQKQAHHQFEEGITESGILSWQSQPHQRLSDPQIQQLIGHDEAKNSIYLFLRTSSRRKYNYLGTLKYLVHDPEREKPVYFQWQILDWKPPQEMLDRIELSLEPIPDLELAQAPAEPLVKTEAPIAARATGTLTKGTRTFRGRGTVDHIGLGAANKELGDRGERLVVDYEKRMLREAGKPELAEKIVHVAEIEGDGAGYDVLSLTVEGMKKYIEVKTTRGSIETDFFVTANELEFSRRHPQSYRLYRVYEYHEANGTGRFYERQGPLDSCFSLVPTAFRARL